MGLKQKCIICGYENAQLSYDIQNNLLSSYQYYHCPSCGRYIIPESSYFLLNENLSLGLSDCYDKIKLSAFLLYNKIENRKAFIGTTDAFKSYLNNKPDSEAFLVTKEMVENWYPKTFEEKINKILLNFAQRSKYFGDETHYSDVELCPMLFMKNTYHKGMEEDLDLEAELVFLLDYFIKNDYIVGYPEGIDLWEVVERIYTLPNNDDSLDFPNFVLSSKAWEKVYDLQKTQVNNKNIFIAMSFNPAIENIYNAIELAIVNAKCNAVSLKHRIHNKQIVPEMLRLIKESKMLVIDISEPNFGAYYEAGYAQGLGKEVIFTCKSSIMKKDKFPCDSKQGEECEFLKKYSKPHFDIAQKQILVWDDEADLTEQLTEWIKLLIG